MNPSNRTRWLGQTRAGRLRLVLAFTALLAVGPIAHAAPVLDGDVDLLYDVNPAVDCPSCTTSQVAELEDGLGMALGRLRRETLNPDGGVCVAEASLIRDLAVLTFNDVRRAGHVSANRWKDVLKAKAIIAGGLSPVTRNSLIRQYQDAVAARGGGTLRAEASAGEQVHQRGVAIYGAARLATIFGHQAVGTWNHAQWLGAGASGQGLGPIVRTALDVGARHGDVLEGALIQLGAADLWRDGQLWHLTSLPDDFAAAFTGRDVLYDAYQLAMAGSMATVMTHGCGAEAAAGMAAEAMRLAEGVGVRQGDKIAAIFHAVSTYFRDLFFAFFFFDSIEVVDTHAPAADSVDALPVFVDVDLGVVDLTGPVLPRPRTLGESDAAEGCDPTQEMCHMDNCVFKPAGAPAGCDFVPATDLLCTSAFTLCQLGRLGRAICVTLAENCATGFAHDSIPSNIP